MYGRRRACQQSLEVRVMQIRILLVAGYECHCDINIDIISIVLEYHE